MTSPTGRLLVVGTPIGNLSDLSPRACQALATADLIAAEDTRHSGLLLQHLSLKKSFLSVQKFNEASRESEILDRIRSGQTIALITDSGMPAISDPGERIIRAVRRENLPVEVIPGPPARQCPRRKNRCRSSILRILACSPPQGARRSRGQR